MHNLWIRKTIEQIKNLDLQGNRFQDALRLNNIWKFNAALHTNTDNKINKLVTVFASTTAFNTALNTLLNPDTLICS